MLCSWTRGTRGPEISGREAHSQFPGRRARLLDIGPRLAAMGMEQQKEGAG